MLSTFLKSGLVMGLGLGLSGLALAAKTPILSEDPNLETIKKSISAKFPELSVIHLQASALPGFYEFETLSQQILYVSQDGRYIFQGDVMDLQPSKPENLTENKKKTLRLASLKTLKNEDLVVFPAKNKGVRAQGRASVFVFMDLDCGYCQKFHKEELTKANDLGLEVRYVSFPRAGIGSDSYNRASKIWCAADKLASFNAQVNGENIMNKPQNKACQADLVNQHFMLGQKLGIRGTPSILLEDGTLIPGYVPADELYKLATEHLSTS
ncbi:MAG: DsbC family protein [Gammaproteobacteria bacterium]